MESKLQAMGYDIIPPWRSMPESNARSVDGERERQMLVPPAHQS